MTQPLRVLTELDAVNLMLFAIGETPVNSIEDTGLGDAVMARNHLRNTSRSVQTRGWKWNTLYEQVLSPAYPTPGRIAVPSNALDVDSSGSDFIEYDVILGFDDDGACLVNVKAGEHSTLFTSSIKCDIVLLKEFDELPSAARDYITAVAAREYQQNILGSVDLSRMQGLSEARAFATLNRRENKMRDANIFRSSYTMSQFMRHRR